ARDPDYVRLSDSAVSDQFTDFREAWVEPAIKPNLKFHSGLFHGRKRGMNSLEIVINRFFAKNMFSRGGSFLDDARVGVGGRANGYGCHGWVGREFVICGGCFFDVVVRG